MPQQQFQWTGAYENWAKAWVRRHFWQVETTFVTQQDAVQQCAVVFSRCLQRYGDKVDNEAWFMALFKRAVIHHWITHSRRASNRRPIWFPEGTKVHPSQRFNREPLLKPCSPADDATLVEIWESASPELQKGLELLSGASQRVLDIILDDARSSEQIDRRWKRFAHIRSERNIVAELRALLRSPNDNGHLQNARTAGSDSRHYRRRREPIY
jgi:hypothetical protein